jgi:hypothetical protein
MDKANENVTAPLTRGTRSGISRKLLTRKASKVPSAPAPAGEPLEANFPSAVSDAPEAPADAGSGALSAPTAAPAQPPTAPAAWSSEDEAGFQALVARRKAAGYQRRGKDLTAQTLKPGTIKPNPDTIVATIVGLVADRGEVSRGELLDLMGTASFPHPKAQPSDRSWCQGYVAGAIRNGFLAVVEAAPTADAGQEG